MKHRIKYMFLYLFHLNSYFFRNKNNIITYHFKQILLGRLVNWKQLTSQKHLANSPGHLQKMMVAVQSLTTLLRNVK